MTPMVKIEHTPEFICSMYKLGYVSQKEFDKFMMSEEKYIPKFNMEQDIPKLAESKPSTMYSLVETAYPKEVRDYIESHADMQQFNSGFKIYMINNVKYVVFDGK